MQATLIATTLGALLTLAVYSFLYKDNPFYKFAEHLVVGVSAGYYLVIYYYNFIDPNVVSPVFLLRSGNTPIRFFGMDWWMALIPGLLGLLLYARFFPKIGWIGRWALGIYVGGYSGLEIAPTMQARVLDQIRGGALPLSGVVDARAATTNLILAVILFGVIVYFAALKKRDGRRNPLVVVGSVVLAAVVAWGAYLLLMLLSMSNTIMVTNLLLVGGLLGTLTYFFFSLKHKGVLGGLARVGIVFIMVGFGASFGYTVMSRVSLLIGRMNFLLHDWLHIV
jgi:hypothetical protein